MTSQSQPIKVFLITGFLGAKKTTLLNRLLEWKANERNAIIENEFGKVSIDSGLIQGEFIDLVEMNNGCICCTMDTEFADHLMEFIKADQRPQNLFVEATGVADPGSLIALLSQEVVQEYFELQPVICLVDAVMIEEWINEVPEVSRQISASDVILINKKSLVSLNYGVHLEQWLKSVNPLAKIELVERANFSIENLEGKYKEKPTLPDPVVDPAASPHNLKSMMFEFETPFNRELLLNQLTVLFFVNYHQIYRVKGTVQIETGSMQVVQSHGRQIDMTPLHDSASENNSGLPDKSRLIVIGKGIRREALDKVFARALVKDSLSEY